MGKKRGFPLIRYQEGTQGQCYECAERTIVVKPEFVVHYDYNYSPKGQVVTERFLCRHHWEANWYNNESKYDPDTGQSEFTSMYLRNWKKRDWVSYEEDDE